MRFMISSRAGVSRAKAAVASLAVAVALGGLSAGAASAQSTNNIGGGEAHGTWAYDSPGVPQAFAPCARDLTFTFGGGSEATIAINVQTEGAPAVVSGFVGTVDIKDPDDGLPAGTAPCEGFSGGGGSLNLEIPTATSTNGSTFGCAELHGGYTRVGPDIEAIMGGQCALNDDEIPVIFVYRGEWIPNDGDGLNQPGLSGPVMSASFEGTFFLVPA